jgi:hypothetical protein
VGIAIMICPQCKQKTATTTRIFNPESNAAIFGKGLKRGIVCQLNGVTHFRVMVDGTWEHRAAPTPANDLRIIERGKVVGLDWVRFDYLLEIFAVECFGEGGDSVVELGQTRLL